MPRGYERPPGPAFTNLRVRRFRGGARHPGMRVLITLSALGFSTAHAAPARSFTLIWNEHAHGTKGEVTATTTFVVSDLTLHFESMYAGPSPDKPSNRPQKLDF